MNLDAYTIRKIAPKLLFAVIGVNLSIYLCVAAIDITNIVGGGLGDLLRGPFVKTGSFNDLKLDGSVLSGVVGVVGGGGALVGLFGLAVGAASIGVLATIGLFLIAIAGIALIALAVLATLVIRYGLIILLTIVSPIAIACWVLPGTEKYFQQWWSIFLRTLIVYPIVAVIFAMSDVLAAIFLKTQGSTNNLNSVVTIFVVVFVLYAPLFFIPFAFKLAGGIIGSVYDFAQQRGASPLMNRVSKWKENPNSWYGSKMNRAKSARQERGATFSQGMAGLSAGIKARRANESFRGGFRGGLQTTQKTYDAALKAEEENEAVKILGNDDDQWHAVKAFSEGRSRTEVAEILKKRAGARFDDAKGGSEVALQEAIAQAQRVQGQLGNKVAGTAAVKAISKTTTGWTDSVEMMNDINAVAGNDRALGSRLLADSMQNQKGVGRIDNGGFSYSTGVGELERMAKGPSTAKGETQATLEYDVQKTLQKSMRNKQGASTVATMDNRGMKVSAPHMLDELKEAYATGNKVSIERASAKLANVYDAMQYTQPENAELLADAMTGAVIGEVGKADENGKRELLTVQKLIENMRKDPNANEFVNMRREWSRDQAAQIDESGKPRPAPPPPPA